MLELICLLLMAVSAWARPRQDHDTLIQCEQS
jgi:hypothetical protein